MCNASLPGPRRCGDNAGVSYGVDLHRRAIHCPRGPPSLWHCTGSGGRAKAIRCGSILSAKWQQQETIQSAVAGAITIYHHPAVIASMSMLLIAPLFPLILIVLLLCPHPPCQEVV